MKFQMLIHKLINTFKTRLIKNNNNNNNIIYQHPQSDKLKRKLALLIKDIETVDQMDLKQVEYKKMNQETKNDLFSSYRLDFHTRDELNRFKTKYRSIIL
jgi:ethanolamine utilization protein EutA (predicted chaperonin)